MANEAWQIKSPGKLALVDLGLPLLKLGPKQALVRVGAVALNYRDKLVVASSPDYPIPPEPDLVPCSDAAGVIEEVGEGSVWKRGDRVVVFPNTWRSGSDSRDLNMREIAGAGDQEGMLRRFLVWDDARLVAAPDGLAIEEASTLITAGLTA